MIKLLQDIWILTEVGTVIYHRGYEQETQDQMFGMLMSVLNNLAEKLADGGMSSVELLDKRFNFMKKRQFIFVGISLKKHKEKKVKEELNFIIEKFFGTYTDLFFTNWDGDVSVFDDFGDALLD